MPNGSSRAGYLKLMARSLAMRRYEGAWISSFWALGLFCLLLLAWQAAVLALAIPEIILPSPTAVADYLIRRNELFLRHTWPTLIQTVLGFGLAVLGGILLATLASLTEIGTRGVVAV